MFLFPPKRCYTLSMNITENSLIILWQNPYSVVLLHIYILFIPLLHRHMQNIMQPKNARIYSLTLSYTYALFDKASFADRTMNEKFNSKIFIKNKFERMRSTSKILCWKSCLEYIYNICNYRCICVYIYLAILVRLVILCTFLHMFYIYIYVMVCILWIYAAWVCHMHKDPYMY